MSSGCISSAADVNQKARADEFVVLLVIAQDVADILAKKTLDAFPEFLHAIDVVLRHPPGAIGASGGARLEFLDLFLHPKIPRNIGDQILHERERLHRLDRDRLVERQIAQPRHAHQLRHAVDFRGTGAAFARFAVPAAGQVVRLLRLDVVNGIEHDHAFGNFRRVILETRRPSRRRARC